MGRHRFAAQSIFDATGAGCPGVIVQDNLSSSVSALVKIFTVIQKLGDSIGKMVGPIRLH